MSNSSLLGTPASDTPLPLAGDNVLADRPTSADALKSERFWMWIISLWLVVQVFHFKYIFPAMGDRTLARALFVLIAVWFVGRILSQKVDLGAFDRVDLMMLIFTTIATSSYLVHGADQGESGNRWLTTLTNLTYNPFIAYLAIKNLPYRRSLVKILLMTLCVLGAYLALIGLIEHYRIQPLAFPGYVLDSSLKAQPGRVNGPIGNAGGMGRLLVVTFLVILMLSTLYSGLRQKILYFLLVLGLATLYLTYTRSVWVGLGLSLVICGLLHRQLRKRTLGLLALVAFAFVFGVTGKFSLFQDTLFSKRQATVQGRMVGWQVTLNMAASHPVFGIGFGQHEEKWFDYWPEKSKVDLGMVAAEVPEREGYDGNHNTYLGILAELGLVGFGTFLLLLIFLGRLCWKTYQESRQATTFDRAVVVVAFASLAMHVLTIFFYDARYAGLQNSLTFILVGLVASLGYRLRHETTGSLEPQATTADSQSFALLPSHDHVRDSQKAPDQNN